MRHILQNVCYCEKKNPLRLQTENNNDDIFTVERNMKENVEAISCFDKIQSLVVEGLIKSLLTPLDILYAKVNKSKRSIHQISHLCELL